MNNESTAARDASNKIKEKRSEFIKQQLDNMAPEELSRFEFATRAHFQRNTIRALITDTLGKSQHVSDQVVICVSALAKMHVADLVEAALEVSAELGNSDSLQPEHLAEAVRRKALANDEWQPDQAFGMAAIDDWRADRIFRDCIAVVDEEEDDAMVTET